jgi:hypothetical protein
MFLKPFCSKVLQRTTAYLISIKFSMKTVTLISLHSTKLRDCVKEAIGYKISDLALDSYIEPKAYSVEAPKVFRFYWYLSFSI